MGTQCGYSAESCASKQTACTSYAASITEAKMQEMATAFASCTGDLASLTMYNAEALTTSMLATFNRCGVTTSLTPPALATCHGAFSQYTGMSSDCGYEGAYTCSASACIANAASASDAMVADMMTGFATCTEDFASIASIYTAEILTSQFLSTFDSCGLTTSLTRPALTSCNGAVQKISQLSSACGSSDGWLTCGASKCTQFAASVTDSVLKDVATGLATCTGVYAAFSSFYTLEVLNGQFLSTFDSCGLTTSLTRPALTSCNGAVQKISQLSSACGSSDDGLTACGANKCTRFAASVTDSALKEMSTGLATCTGIFSMYSAYDPAMVIIPRLDECGLETSASRPPLNTCTGASILWTQNEHCGSAGARTCSAACSAFVSSVTAAAVQDLTTGFSACAGRPIFERYAVESVRVRVRV